MSQQVTDAVEENDELDDLLYADEEKLRHEILYQRQRIKNLENFKTMFFSLKNKLDITADTTTSDTDSDTNSSLINQLEQNLKEANNMAMLSMITIGEYGSVLNFCKMTVTAESYDDLIELIYECTDAYNIKASIQLRGINGISMYFQDESYKDEDTEIMNNLKDEGRIIEQENIIMLNHKYLSLCIRNFPEDDSEKTGRLKDYLAILASAADNCIKTLDTDVKLARQYQNLQTILNAVPQMIEKIQQGINIQNEKAVGIYRSFVNNMEEMVKKQGMSDKCKNILASLTSSNMEEFKKTFAKSANLTDNLVHIIKQLEQTYIDNESDVDIRDEIELPGTNDEQKNKQNESPLDF